LKKYYILFTLLFVTLLCSAQYNENFDAYTPGVFIGATSPSCTTWSGTTGGNEDAQVVNTHSLSPSNSLHLSGNSASGGPQHVVLSFGNVMRTGTFQYFHGMRVKAGASANLNLQRDLTFGSASVLSIYFSDTGTFTVSDGQGKQHMQGNYIPDMWFVLSFEIDLSTNNWEVLINGSTQGSFTNPTNQLAAIHFSPLNLSPSNNLSEFWIDEVSFTHTPYTLPPRNGAVLDLAFRAPLIDGLNQKPRITIRNLGTQPLNSFDLTATYNGQTLSQTINNVHIASFETYTFEFGQTFLLTTAANSLSATISNVNGSGADLDPADDTKSRVFSPIVAAPGKLVVVEEATGTWCSGCPRGIVTMEFLQKDYKDYAFGIAVHGYDPMEHAAYSTGMVNAIFGYPSALVNRSNAIDPGDIFDPVLEEIQIAPTALIENGAKYNSANNTLNVSALVHFQTATSGDWRIVAVLTEDSVHGTAAGYAQANYYSNFQDLIGYNGENWRNLPAPVPASQMIYNHVARAIAPSFNGAPNDFPTSIGANTLHAVNFSFTLDPNWDMKKMHVVTMLVKPNGHIDNGNATTLTEAIANGFTETGTVSLSENLLGPDAQLQVYPNPVNRGQLTITLNNTEDATITLVNMRGEILHAQQRAVSKNRQTWSINAASLPAGVYVVKAAFDQKYLTHKLVVEK
jgi:thiol-disulfide isomerase/thioredoxin